VLGEYTLLATYDWYEQMAPLERLVRFAWLDAEMQYPVLWTEFGRGRNFEASRFVRDGESLIGWQPIVAGTETVQSAEKTLALIRLTPDGNVPRVMWRDRRGDAPGVYVRRFRCTAEATTSDGP